MKKKIYTVLLCGIVAWSGISAQETVKAFEHLSMGLEVSTTGIGLELATPLSSNFALRGGFSLLPFSYDATFGTNVSESLKNKIDNAVTSHPDIEADLIQQGLPTRARDINTDVDATASLNFFNGKFLIDYYPAAKHSFHITAGLYIGKSNLIKLEGKMQEAVDVLNVLKNHGVNYFDEPFFSDYQVQGKDLLDIKGAISVNSVKPYLGLGFGRVAPKGRVGVNFEIGAFYQGTPKLTSENSNIQKLLDDELTDISDVFNKLSIYPVISLKLNFRIF